MTGIFPWFFPWFFPWGLILLFHSVWDARETRMWRVYGKGKKKREFCFRENLPPNISNLGCYIQFRETKPKKKGKKKERERRKLKRSLLSLRFGLVQSSRHVTYTYTSLSLLSLSSVSLSLSRARALAQVNTPPFSFSGHEWLGRDWLRCRRRRWRWTTTKRKRGVLGDEHNKKTIGQQGYQVDHQVVRYLRFPRLCRLDCLAYHGTPSTHTAEQVPHP